MQGAQRLYFTSNHDENSWNGTEMERMGDARFVMAVLSYAMNGMPLIYNGQETSLDRRLLFFEKDQINWDKMDMERFYITLNTLKQYNKCLAADRNETYMNTELLNDGKVLVFKKKRRKDKKETKNGEFGKKKKTNNELQKQNKKRKKNKEKDIREDEGQA